MVSRIRDRSSPPTQSHLDLVGIKGMSSRLIETLEYTQKEENIEDTVTPQYHKKIAEGFIVNNSCWYTSVTKQLGNGSVTYSSPSSGTPVTSYSLVGHLCDKRRRGYGVELLPPPVLSASLREAQIKAIANIDSTPFQFGEDALEVRKTIQFLRNPIASLLEISRAFKKAKRKNFRGARLNGDLLDASAGGYLAYRFALSPLIRSCISALEAYSLVEKQKPPRLTSRGFSGEESDLSDQVSAPDAMFTRQTIRKLQEKATILYIVSNPIYDWRYRLGFRTKDLPVTVWQIFPYSFMIDRLVDISSFLKGAVNLLDPDVNILAASTTSRDEITQKISLEEIGNASWSMVGSGGEDSSSSFSYTRLVWHPSVYDLIPRVTPENIADTATKMADTVALIIRNFR